MDICDLINLITQRMIKFINSVHWDESHVVALLISSVIIPYFKLLISIQYGVAVFPRMGFDLEAIKADLLEEDPSYRITLLDAELVNVSSTMIREGMARGEDVSQYLM